MPEEDSQSYHDRNTIEEKMYALWESEEFSIDDVEEFVMSIVEQMRKEEADGES